LHKKHERDYYIAREASVLERLWVNELEIGEFLGYPDCCANAFYAGCEKAMTQGFEWGPAVQFLRKRKVNDNLLFDYNFHVPCSIECEPSLMMGKAIKEVLEKNDPGAAVALREWNQYEFYEFYYFYPPDGFHQ